MDLKRIAILFAAIFIFTPQTHAQSASSNRLYKEMSRAERLEFVHQQARRIAREISGNEYEFTPAFEVDIQQAVSRYAERIGNGGASGTDLRLVVERGQLQAPLLSATFRARNVSPLIGLYLPWIESEYINIESPTPAGSIGMFQFLPSTGERFGLSKQDLLDIGKSADAAARYITDSIEVFKNDPMKEALALLSYNRGAPQTTRSLKILLNDQNRRCSICALTSDRRKVDETLTPENTFYVPRFFAAAIIGENPQAFGLQMQPLSSY